MGKRKFKLECMSGSSVNIVMKGWYIRIVTELCMILNINLNIKFLRCSLRSSRDGS